MEDGFCTDCKTYTSIVYDHSEGDSICADCGLVLESRSIDETCEWRTFAKEAGAGYGNPVRVGGPSNPLLRGGGLGTVIAKRDNNNLAFGDSCSSSRLGQWYKVMENPDAPLINNFKSIAIMADSLGLVETIKNHAKELYKKLDDQKACKGRKLSAIMAACLFYACQEESFPRTVKEISTVTNGVTIKEINRAKKFLKEKLEIGHKFIHAADLARRYCSKLGLNTKQTKAVLETVKKSDDFDIRRNSTSILAAVILMITQLSDETLRLQGLNSEYYTTPIPNLFKNY